MPFASGNFTSDFGHSGFKKKNFSSLNSTAELNSPKKHRGSNANSTAHVKSMFQYSKFSPYQFSKMITHCVQR